MKRPAFVLHAFHDIHADFERAFSILRQSLSANDRDVPPRHVSVCRLVRNLGQQWINPKLLVSKANLVKRR